MKHTLCGLFGVALLAGTAWAAPQPGFIVDEWLVLGSFAFERDTDPYTVEPPALLLDAAPGIDSTFDGRRWFVVPADPDGQVDLIGHGFEPEEIAMAWMLAYVWSPVEQGVTLSVGSDDGIQVFVNGVETHTNWTLRGWSVDQDRFVTRFGAGWNRVLLRVSNQTGGFAGSAGVLDASGVGTPAGLRAQAATPRDYAPVSTAAFLDVQSGRAGERLFSESEVGSEVEDESEPALAAAPELADDPATARLPVYVTIRNRGTQPAEPVTLYLGTRSGRHSTSRTVQVPAGAHEIALFPTALDVATAIGAGESFEVRMAWNGPADARDASIEMTAGDVLGALTAGTGLRRGFPVDHEAVVEMLVNRRWAERFRPDLLDGAEETTRTLVGAYVAGDESAFAEAWDALHVRMAIAAREIREQRITFVGNSHIDMAWLWDRDETLEVVDMTYDQALEFMDEYPFFLYAQSQMQTFEWVKERFPEMMRRMDAATRKERFIPVGGMWVEPDCNLASGESYVRQLLYGKGWVRDRWGYDIRIGWNPDSFGYAWTLPMIFKGAGIDYFITQKIGWNDTTEFPHRLFWWEAPDGSRVLSYFPFTYVDDAQPEVLADRLARQQEQQPGLVDMLNLYGVGDHGGGPTRAMIERYIDMKATETYPVVEHAPPLEFMQRVERKYEGQVPVWDDELYLEYHRGTYTTQGRIKQRNRQMEAELEAAEKFAAIATALSPSHAYPDGELDGAWLRTLFNQFHDILPGSGIAEIFEDAHADYDEAEAMVGVAKSVALMTLANRIDTRKLKGAPVAVFNPLSWSRSGVVGVPVVDLDLPAKALGVFTIEGELLPSEVDSGVLQFLARDVPSVGYRTFLVRPSKSVPVQGPVIDDPPAEGTIRLRNAHLSATIDEASGDVVSLRMLPSGIETLTAGGANVLQLFGDEPEQWDAWNIGYTGEEWGSADAKVLFVEDGPLRTVVRVVRAIGSSRLAHDYVLEAGSPWLDIRTSVVWNEERKLLKTAFHFAVEADVATFEIPYGSIERPTRPRTEAERAKWEVSGHRWVDMTDRSGRFGVTIVDDSKYGYDLAGERLSMTLLKAPTWPDPGADRGEHAFGYALYPHDGDWRDAASHRRGAEYNVPLVPRVVERKQQGPLPASHSFVGVNAPNVTVTAFKALREKDRRPGYALRLTEAHGRRTDVTVTLPFPIATAHRANLMEDPLDPLPVECNTVQLPIKPHALETILVVPTVSDCEMSGFGAERR